LKNWAERSAWLALAKERESSILQPKCVRRQQRKAEANDLAPIRWQCIVVLSAGGLNSVVGNVCLSALGCARSGEINLLVDLGVV
jgi:hypothetical protein